MLPTERWQGPLRMSPDRRARDLRIRQLHAEGVPLGEIAAKVGLSRERARQIAATPTGQAALADQETALRFELDLLVRHAEVIRRRIWVVRRALDRIAEEQEVVRIDRLLGLA